MQPAITVGLALGLAYLLGDFPFQSFRLTNSRSQGWTKIVGHGLIHWLIVLLLVVVFASHYVVLSWRFAIMASCYVIFHLALDAGRGHLIRHKCVADSTTTFLMDQGLHCAVVFGFTLGVTKIDWQAVRELGTISENTRNLGLAGAIVYGSVVFAGGYDPIHDKGPGSERTVGR